MSRRFAVLGILFLCLVLEGCKGAPTVRVTDLAPVTADTITLVLIGIPEHQRATRPTAEAGILKADVYESVMISADAEAFAKVSRGTFTVRDIESLQKDVVNKVAENLKPHRFTARGAKYPPAASEPKTVIATLTPVAEVTGSPEDRAAGKGKTMVLVRLTVTDPRTGAILADRQYYSGTDAKNQPLREFR